MSALSLPEITIVLTLTKPLNEPYMPHCTCSLEVATQHDCLEVLFCFSSTWCLMDIRSFVTRCNVSLHTFLHRQHTVNILVMEDNCVEKQGTLSETNY